MLIFLLFLFFSVLQLDNHGMYNREAYRNFYPPFNIFIFVVLKIQFFLWIQQLLIPQKDRIFFQNCLAMVPMGTIFGVLVAMPFDSYLKAKEIILNILSILVLCYHFDEGALFIFTAFHVQFLAAASNDYTFETYK